MYLWESDIQEAVVFTPVEIRGKKGRKKMKNSNTAIYIPNMNADSFQNICDEKGLQFVYVPVPPHGRLIDADALLSDVRQNSESYFADDFAHEWVDVAPTVIPASEEGEQ